MKYIKMFDNLDNLKIGKPTKQKYKRIREFIKTKEMAERLDRLKVPNWYVDCFTDWSLWQLTFLDREITHEQKICLFEEFLANKVKLRYGREKLLWKIKSCESYEVTSRIHKFTKSTITEEEGIIWEEKRKKKMAEYGKRHGSFRFNFNFRNIKFSNSNDNYKTLGLERGATKEEIKKAYRNLSKKYHPDMGGSNEKFNEINNAYSQLKEVI